MLAPETGENRHIDYPPCQMEAPFTGEEIRKVVNRMTNEKSAGPDDLKVELITYSSIEIHDDIANIFNTLSRTGEDIKELTLGILHGGGGFSAKFRVGGAAHSFKM